MPEWGFQVLAMVFGAGTVYGAIRADLREIHERLRHAENTADEAHKRLDEVLLRRVGEHG